MNGASVDASAWAKAMTSSVWLIEPDSTSSAIYGQAPPGTGVHAAGSARLSATVAHSAPAKAVTSGGATILSVRFSTSWTEMMTALAKISRLPALISPNVGRITSSTPPKPATTPAQTGQPARSPRNSTARMTIRNG